uniref:Immunoglobulin V-set domain-containing protein n=1 Tax=Meleagris gallopavo TaxID=9103 RepID=A0A803YCU7_MELGA
MKFLWKRMDILSLLLVFFSAVAVSRAQVQQETAAETSEGTGINITCSLPDILSNDYIHWYRQLPGRGPAFLVSALKGSKEVPDPEGRLWVSADRRSSALWLLKRGVSTVCYNLSFFWEWRRISINIHLTHSRSKAILFVALEAVHGARNIKDLH